METYFTIKESKEAELTEKRSRFLSYVSPASNKDEADAFLDKIRALHPQATYVCWAYQVGAPDNCRTSSWRWSAISAASSWASGGS